MNAFDEQNLRAALKGRTFGSIVFHGELDSTNTEAWRLAERGAPEGTLVIADRQTRGRGRMDRVWYSPPGGNFYGSFILRPPITPDRAPQITLTAGVAVAEVLSRYCPDGVEIKWPNDVLIKGKKACGILTEMKAVPAGVVFVILGVGINVNMEASDFTAEIRDRATSLMLETSAAVDRVALTVGLVESLEKWYRVFLRDGFQAVRGQWIARSRLAGKRIRVSFKERTQTGLALGIDDEGAVVMREDTGLIRRITAGDVTEEK